MRILWLSNMVPGCLRQQLEGRNTGGMWLDHVLQDLRQRKALQLRLLCPWQEERTGALDDRCSYHTFRKLPPTAMPPERKDLFLRELREFQPDVIHVWGTEFGHTLSMAQAVETLGLTSRMVISLQGICTYIAVHYAEGIPLAVQRRFTLRDFLRQDNILQQQKAFVLRGEKEAEALKLCRHVMGRTHWDRACALQLNPDLHYHHCDETLQDCFYQGTWSYEACEKHRIFISSRLYAAKGFHYALEALAVIRKRYPDAVLAVPGSSPCCHGKARLRQDSYARYLAELMEAHNLSGAVEYLGPVDTAGMYRQYLKANVFILPSTIENSSNCLGEAMLLGTPCVAADVGGTATLLEPGREGLVYQGTASYMLADAVERIFAMEGQAEQLGQAARAHALRTHDPRKNLQDLLQVYDTLSQGEKPV